MEVSIEIIKDNFNDDRIKLTIKKSIKFNEEYIKMTVDGEAFHVDKKELISVLNLF